MNRIIDTHIHLDLYTEREVAEIMTGLEEAGCTGLISVSCHLASCRENLRLAEKYDRVYPAFGFHPEQELPSENEVSDLLSWMEKHRNHMIAVGEVGLPFYLRSEEGSSFSIDRYVELLEQMILKAKQWTKPIILHAIYDDAPIVCDLLEKHGVEKAHFHWFKGDSNTVARMVENGWFVSVTPDVAYEQEIKDLVGQYPIEQMMVETDGPWKFEGPFSGKMTHPNMIHHAIGAISEIKNFSRDQVYKTIYKNSRDFYGLDMF